LLPPFVVAAAARKAAPRPALQDPSRPRPEWLPVGVRHALGSGSAVPASKEQALCGEAVSGWFIFGHTAFTGSHAADCRRCEQLLPRVLPEVDKGVSGRHTVPG